MIFMGTLLFPEKKLPFDKPMRIKMDPLDEENQPTINEETKFTFCMLSFG